MRLVKFKLSTTDGTGDDIYIAPGAVVAVQNRAKESPPNVLIFAGDYWHCVAEDIDTVMNKLYYKNDGGHQFGAPTTEGKPV